MPESLPPCGLWPEDGWTPQGLVSPSTKEMFIPYLKSPQRHLKGEPGTQAVCFYFCTAFSKLLLLSFPSLPGIL